MNLTQRFRFKLNEFALPLFILVLAIATGLIEPRFWSSDNLVNLSRQLATLMVISVGQALAVISGGLDLSLAAVLALSGVYGVIVMNKAGLAIGVLMMLLTGAGFGFINGCIITVFGVSPFIVTLGMLSVARGLALIATGGLPLYDVPSALSDIFGFSNVFGIPTPALIAIATLLLGHVLLRHTVFGRYVYAIGSNTRAAFNSGINVRVQTLLIYTFTGTTAGVAAVVLTAWVSAAQPLAATGLELQSLAAVVVGGVALTGGMGSMLNAFYGVLILGMLSNSLNMVGVSSFMQTLVIGLVIVIAVVLDKVRRNGV
ncbi:MAG: ABC transporter permease [Stenomitos rutilans HA7619-LM2]|jgi:ribose transport system permease protein|nr:ABC transporter permease [Stenomitos rutilans HA7619-LM2]